MPPIAARPPIRADVLAQETLTRRVIGAFYDVYNGLGHGFLESVYARALAFELRQRGLSVVSELPIEVSYRGVVVGHFRADLLVESVLVLELKATPVLHDADRRQLINYLTASQLEVGLLLHFGLRPTVQRAVATNRR